MSSRNLVSIREASKYTWRGRERDSDSDSSRHVMKAEKRSKIQLWKDLLEKLFRIRYFRDFILCYERK